jgi:hypothetical protein
VTVTLVYFFFVVANSNCYCVLIHCNNPAVRYGYAMRIPSKVLDNSLRARKGSFCRRTSSCYNTCPVTFESSMDNDIVWAGNKEKVMIVICSV